MKDPEHRDGVGRVLMEWQNSFARCIVGVDGSVHSPWERREGVDEVDCVDGGRSVGPAIGEGGP